MEVGLAMIQDGFEFLIEEKAYLIKMPMRLALGVCMKISIQAQLISLRESQFTTGEELSALLPSVLDRAFKGEL